MPLVQKFCGSSTVQLAVREVMTHIVAVIDMKLCFNCCRDDAEKIFDSQGINQDPTLKLHSFQQVSCPLL